MEVIPKATMSRLLLLLPFFYLLSIAPVLCVVNDKCAACKAIALELEEALANERPRNHLDYRHRLGSSGQREGKVIDYKVSELRVVELLDGLCSQMKGYIPNRSGPGQEFWLKVEGPIPDVPEMAQNRQHSEVHSRAIVEFCGRLLETTEEELTEKIRIGEVATGDVERVLCKELSLSCKQTLDGTPADPEEDDEEDEVDEVAPEGGHESQAKIEESEEVPNVEVQMNLKDAVSMGNDGEL